MKPIVLVQILIAVIAAMPAVAEEPTTVRRSQDFVGKQSLNTLFGDFVDEQGLVNYRELQAKPAPLDDYIRRLGKYHRKGYELRDQSQQIAFWINAYNALTLRVIIDHYPIQSGGFFASMRFPKNSIRQIDGAWDGIKHNVMGESMTLDQIEHKILRKQFKDPRIHMALVCAAMGCPPLRNEPYVGGQSDGQLDDQLDDQARKFFSNPDKFRIDRANQTVHLSSIFKWFGKDFKEKYATGEFRQLSGDARPVMAFAVKYVAPREAQYLKTQDYRIEYLDYDWSLNEQR